MRALLRLPLFGISALLIYLQASPSLGQSSSATARLTINRVSDGFAIAYKSPLVDVTSTSIPGGMVDRISIDGATMTSVLGKADLPVITKCILLPERGEARLVIESIDYIDSLGINPPAAPLPECDSYSLAAQAASVLDQSGFWPPSPVEIGKPTILRGYRIACVKLYPVQYDAATGVTRFNRQVKFHIETSGQGENELTRRTGIVRSEAARRAVADLVVNPEDLPQRDALLEGSYLYIVPNVNGVEGALAPLLDWRRRMGHRVTVARVNNNASIATITNTIADAYNSDDPVEFVSLVGDAADGDFNIPAATQTGDYRYTLVDGDDELPDVALGRISVANLNQLRLVVSKIVTYETTPYMDDTHWFKQGAVVAGHVGNGLGEILLAKWVRKELLEVGYDEVRHWYWDEDGEIDGNQPFVTNAFDWGVGIFHYRAFSHMNLIPLNVITNLPNTDGRWPAVLAISCNTGNFVSETNGDYGGRAITEEFLRARGGGIGAIGTATPHTNVRFNNLVAGGVWRGVWQLGMYCFGWGLVQGKTEIWRAYDGLDEAYTDFMDWNNLMGDPGTAIWTDVPERIVVDYPHSISPSTGRFIATITRSADHTPIEGVQVCLWKGDEIHAVQQTNANGRVEFGIAPGTLTTGTLKITALKHNVLPFLADVEVAQPASILAVTGWHLDDDNQGASSGNDDTLANPGEIVELRLEVKNLGNAIQGGLVVAARSDTPWTDVLTDTIRVDQVPAPGEQVQVVLTVRVNNAARNLSLEEISIDLLAAQAVFPTMATFPITAPQIEAGRTVFEGGSLNRGEVKWIDVEIRNVGQVRLESAEATLWSDSRFVSVVDERSSFDPVSVGNADFTSGRLFRLAVHPLTTPGTVATLHLALETADGFRDTTTFQVVAGSPGQTDPFGPEDYGYVCYDSGDRGWPDTRPYSWLEINPNEQGRLLNGTNLNITDAGDNDDSSRVVNLPFGFRYYGQEFNQLTICTNGWAAFGDQDELANFRNQHIGQAICANAMLAVWWDNLITPENARIFTGYDRDNQRFIVEWYQMQRYVEGGGGARETFQLVLYPRQGEDGVVVYQYKQVTNENRMAHNDIPYCTIGISDLRGMGGLEYTYWNMYPAGARAIGNEMAVTFTTGSRQPTGAILGTITDAATGLPVVDARIITSNGFWARSDSAGQYRVTDVLAGDNYSVTARAIGYNDSVRALGRIAVGDEVRADFALLHPTMNLSVDHFGVVLGQGEQLVRHLRISNNGNGPLSWSGSIRTDGPQRDPGTFITSLSVGQITRDNRVEGAVYANGNFYITGAQADPNKIYVLDRDGALVRSFDQCGHARYGMKDLEWDGELIWGSGEDTLYGFDLDGQVIRKWRGVFNPTQAIAWDDEREILWTSGLTTQIEGVTRDGQRPGRIIHRLQDMRIYGMTYNRHDPDGMPLYILCRELATDRMLFYRANPDQDNVTLYKVLEAPGAAVTTGGIAITGSYEPLTWTLIQVAQQTGADPNDFLHLYHLTSRNDWAVLAPSSGTLLPGNEADVVVTFDALDLAPTRINGSLVMLGNDAVGKRMLPIDMRIHEGQGGGEARIWSLQQGWNLASLNIAPFESRIPVLVQPLTDAGNLLMMKDGRGRFFRPADGFNNIPDYDSSSAYQLFLSAPAQLEVIGEVVPPDQPIHLEAGWNMASYYPREESDAPSAFERIAATLVVAKDASGHFYFPAYNFNSMQPLHELAGYQIKTRAAVDFVWQTGRERFGDDVIEMVQIPVHWKEPAPSEVNMSLLILGRSSDAGKEVGVFGSNDELLGAGRFDRLGRCGVPLWNSSEGELLSLRVWNDEVETEPMLKLVEGELRFANGGVVVVSLQGGSGALPDEYVLDEPFPNPFNSSTTLRFGLPERSEVKIGIYDLQGRLVRELLSCRQEAGYGRVVWNSGGSPSGVYICRMKAGGQALSVKLVLTR